MDETNTEAAGFVPVSETPFKRGSEIVEKKPNLEKGNSELRREVIGLLLEGKVTPQDAISLVAISADYIRRATDSTVEVDVDTFAGSVEGYAREHVAVVLDAIALQRQEARIHKTADQGEVEMAVGALRVLEARDKDKWTNK